MRWNYPCASRLPVFSVPKSGSSYSVQTGLYMQGYSDDSISRPNSSHQSTATSCSFPEHCPTNLLIYLSSLTPMPSSSWSWSRSDPIHIVSVGLAVVRWTTESSEVASASGVSGGDKLSVTGGMVWEGRV